MQPNIFWYYYLATNRRLVILMSLFLSYILATNHLSIILIFYQKYMACWYVATNRLLVILICYHFFYWPYCIGSLTKTKSYQTNE